MHRHAPALAASLALAGCYLDGPHSRDGHRTLDQIRQEHRWAADEIGRRLSAEELGRVRSGDAAATRKAKKRLVRLIDALDRVVWIREAAPRALWASAEDPGDQDELAFRNARALQLRNEALAEADEVAEALATSGAPGAISWADLTKGLLAVQKAERSEAAVARDVAEVVKKEPSLKAGAARLSPVALPQVRPFVAAAGAWLRAHPDERGELDRLPKELQPDADRIRASLAEERAPATPAPVAEEPQKRVPQEPTPEERAAARDGQAIKPRQDDAGADEKLPGEKAAPPGDLLQLQGDARKMLESRGLPKAFGQRADGSFALRYEEPRPCASGSCATLVDYVFNAAGGLLREEPVGAPAKPQRIEDPGDGDQ